MNRNMYFSSVLGCNLGMFYKRRDYSRIVNGRNPIVAHEYLGESVEGKDVFIADDIIASGESMLDIAYELKMRGARNIFTCCTFRCSPPVWRSSTRPTTTASSRPFWART